MTEFERPTYTKVEIVKATETVLKYIEATDKEGFFPSDISEALDMDFWLVLDVFSALVEQGVFERPVFEPGFCPHPSFAIVIDPDSEETEEPQYSLHCHDCREDLPFFFYTKGEWEKLTDHVCGEGDDGNPSCEHAKASSTRPDIGESE